jgi:hypothetical protein
VWVGVGVWPWCDHHRRAVGFSEGKELAASNGATFMEISARTAENVEQVGAHMSTSLGHPNPLLRGKGGGV